MNIKRILIQVIKYSVGPIFLIGAVWWLWQKDVEGKEGITRFDWALYAAAFFICTASTLLTIVRWYVLVKAQDMPFTLRNAMSLGLMGLFFSTFLPGSVMGDIPKMYFLARDQSRRTVAVATVVIDRIIGLCGLIWLAALLGGVFWWTGELDEMVATQGALHFVQFIVIISWILLASTLVFWFALGLLPLRLTTHWIARIERMPKVGHSLAELCRATLMYRLRSRAVGLAMVMSMVGHVGFVVTYYLCSLSVNTAAILPSGPAHVLIVPVGMAVQAGMPTPGGMGLGDFGFGFLYEGVGYVSKKGVAMSLMKRLLDSVLAALGFMVYLQMKPSFRAAAAEQRLEAAELEEPIDEQDLQKIAPTSCSS